MSSSYAPCAACKYLRRKCTQECVFAPYFPPDNPQKFINVHKVFGASNVGKILNELNPTQRNDAVHSLAYEAESRIKDPIYGCVGYVSILQHHLRQVQQEIDRAKKELATYIGPAAMQPILNSPAHLIQLQQQQQNFDPSSLYNNNQLMAGAYQQGQLMIQEPPHQEMLRAYAQQQQQEQQQQHMFAQQQQQELYAQQQQQQQRMYVQQQQQQQQQFNDGFVQMEEQPALALGGSFEAHYNQTPEEEEDQKVNSHHQQHNQHQFQIQELLLQSPQHLQLMPQQYGAVIKRDGSEEEEEGQGEVEEGDEGRSFGPL